MEEHLTPNEFASKFKVKPKAVREWLKSGVLQGVKFGRIWRISLTEAQRFLQTASKGT